MANDANPSLPARATPLVGLALAHGRRVAPHLPAAATVGFALLAGYAIAAFGWKVYDLVSPAPVPSVVAPAPSAMPVEDPGATAERLASLDPFGALAPGAATTAEAPDTRLDLKLTGVIAGGTPGFSRAFIVSGDDVERGYAVGSVLPGGATVHSVHPDRVVLSRNGALETLRLPREQASGGSAPEPVAATEVRSAQASPSRLLEWMRPVAATEGATGRQLGYRVYPGRDPDRFTKLGLLPGDLITAVNGQTLDDPSRSMELLRSLSASDSITLTIEREGAQRLVQIPVLQ